MTAACQGQVEESPHSIERDTGEYPDRGNPVDRATEINRLETGKGAKAVQETTGRFSNERVRQPLSGARSNRCRLFEQERLVLPPHGEAASGGPHELIGDNQPR
jgi:hypothetical protein